MDEVKILSIWVFDFLLHHVLSDALEHLSGLCRDPGVEAGRNPALDMEAAVELGLSRNVAPPGRGAVCLRILQRDAHLHGAGAYHYGAVQASQLVRLLPYGNHDSADLQSKKRDLVTEALI